MNLECALHYVERIVTKVPTNWNAGWLYDLEGEMGPGTDIELNREGMSGMDTVSEGTLYRGSRRKTL